MIAFAKDAPLKVMIDGTTNPYLLVPGEWLSPVTDVFNDENVRYQIDRYGVSSGGQHLSLLDLGPDAGVERVQQILDRISADLPQQPRRRRPVPLRQEVCIRGEPETMRNLRRRLDALDSMGGWTRRRDIETRGRETRSGGRSAFSFEKPFPAIGGRVSVSLVGGGPQDWSGLILDRYSSPLDRRERLELDEHNLVVADIRDEVIVPLTREVGARVLNCTSPEESSFEVRLPLDSRLRLETFAGTASRDNLREDDLRRWATFIAQMHADNAEDNPEQLAAWLVAEDFPEDQRARLLRDYESGRKLLSAYDEVRG